MHTNEEFNWKINIFFEWIKVFLFKLSFFLPLIHFMYTRSYVTIYALVHEDLCFPVNFGHLRRHFSQHKAERLLLTVSGGGRTGGMSKGDWHNGRRFLNNWSSLREDFACQTREKSFLGRFYGKLRKIVWISRKIICKSQENLWKIEKFMESSGKSAESMKDSGTWSKLASDSQKNLMICETRETRENSSPPVYLIKETLE